MRSIPMNLSKFTASQRHVINACSWLALLACIALAAFAMADDNAQKQPAGPQSGSEIKTEHLLLRPAEPPHAALKYRLLPRGIEQTPGNAAPHYFRAAQILANDKDY